MIPSMTDDAWIQQGQQALAALQPLRFMVGSWTGEGQHQGQAVQGSLEVEAILDGSWLRATETVVALHDQSQTIDISYYRWNDQAESLQLFQLFEHGHLNTLLVEATEAGFRWITGPMAPQLHFEKTSTGFRYRAQIEGQADAITEMNYVPA